ncbi:MOSC domain-containing protein [Bacillus lacus]|uniref:MOSC domain-containing protein n=1 Tax=Metabacillus lacus TaxID=1983721 RepID=A0A7X2IYH5_9BACI|nr:MOSC domain-containing protein [Metabacillus lacus]MRX71984.1 MOSC domain-containing protein [Metabacillus lacus]
MKGTIISLSKGKPKKLMSDGRSFISGIAKTAEKELFVTGTEITGDAVANTSFHGGADRVVCVYSHEHYTYWEKELGLPLQQAAFGENLTVSGMVEDQVCVGDRFSIGTAILEVSQGRFPCVTINLYNSQNQLLQSIFETGYTGYFFRVVKEGKIETEDIPIRIFEHPAKLSVAFIHHIFFHDKKNAEAIFDILQLDELAEEWKRKFLKLQEKLNIED